MKIFNIVILLFLISGSILKAQVDGTLEIGSVSTSGQFLLNKIGDFAIFKAQGTKSYKKYFPDEVDFLKIGNRKYQTIKVDEDSEAIIARILVQGKYSLFEKDKKYFYSGGNEIIELVRRVKEVDSKLIEYQDYLIVLKKIFADDENIMEELKNVKYERISLKRIFEKYNINNFQNEVIFIEKNAGKELTTKHLVGFNLAYLGIEYFKIPKGFSTQSNDRSLSYSIGYSLKIINSWNLSTETGIFYTKVRSSLIADYSLGQRILDFDNDFIELPLALNWNLFPKATTPRLTAGFKCLLPLTKKIEYSQSPDFIDEDYKINNSFWGYFLGFGVKKNINSRVIFFDVLYEFTRGSYDGLSDGDLILKRNMLRLMYQF